MYLSKFENGEEGVEAGRVFLECGLLGNYEEHWREATATQVAKYSQISAKLFHKQWQYNPHDQTWRGRY